MGTALLTGRQVVKFPEWFNFAHRATAQVFIIGTSVRVTFSQKSRVRFRWYGFQGAETAVPVLAASENGLWSVWIFRDHVFANANKRCQAGGWQANIGTLRVARPLFRMLYALRHALTRVGESTTHPAAFAVVAVYAVAWLIFSPDTFGWAAIATLATWLMTFFINRTEHRDTQAIHAKIDELLRTQGKARAELTTLDERDVEDIEEHRRQHRKPDTQGAYSSWPKSDRRGWAR